MDMNSRYWYAQLKERRRGIASTFFLVTFAATMRILEQAARR